MPVISANPISARPISASPISARAVGAADISWSTLFADGELGGVFIAAEYSYGNNGSESAGADDAVALALSIAAGAELGPEIITNGFGDPNEWVSNSDPSGWTVADGKATFDGSTVNEQLEYRPGGQEDVNTTLKYRTYLATVTLADVGPTSTHIRHTWGGSVHANVPISGAGTYPARIKSMYPNSNGVVVLQSYHVSGADDYLTITDFSARKIAGWHAHQATASDRPYLRAADDKYAWVGGDDGGASLVVNFTESLGSDCTVITATATGVTTLTGQNISDSHDILGDYWVYGALVINRALTSAETAYAEAYMDALRYQDWPDLPSINLSNCAFDQTAVDDFIDDLYGWWTTGAGTYATPTLNIGGSNAAPSGTYQAANPPTTPLEKIYAMVNDPNATGNNTWTITYTAP